MNTQTLDSRVQTINDEIRKYKKTPVKLSEIRKVGANFYSGTTMINNTALNDLLNIFSIKNDLLTEIKSDNDQWEPLQRALANIKNDKTVTAITYNTDKSTSVNRIFRDTIEEEQELNLSNGVNLITDYYNTSKESVSFHDMRFNAQTLQIETQFRNLQNKVNVFNDGADFWDTGFNISFGENRTSISPFLLRLICTNGMTATEMISQRFINNSLIKQRNFNKLVNKAVNEDYTAVVIENCNRLSKSNASLREFFAARDIVAGFSSDISKEYFNDDIIQEAYKPYKIKYKNSKWLSTANSNVNGYDFFNSLTHCTSHQAIDDYTRMKLNHLASQMFFKGPDLALQAPNPFINN